MLLDELVARLTQLPEKSRTEAIDLALSARYHEPRFRIRKGFERLSVRRCEHSGWSSLLLSLWFGFAAPGWFWAAALSWIRHLWLWTRAVPRRTGSGFMASVHRAGLGAFLVQYSDPPKAKHSLIEALLSILTKRTLESHANSIAAGSFFLNKR